jgi:hypothetical protein
MHVMAIMIQGLYSSASKTSILAYKTTHNVQRGKCLSFNYQRVNIVMTTTCMLKYLLPLLCIFYGFNIVM